MSAALLTARFAGAALEWCLHRDGVLVDSGRIHALHTAPLEELRRLEIRAGATVEIPAAALTPDELAYARARGWRLG